jgi:hypothetical protein
VCFINRVDGGSEWLAIKKGTPFEAIAFGWLIAEQGRLAAPANS